MPASSLGKSRSLLRFAGQTDPRRPKRIRTNFTFGSLRRAHRNLGSLSLEYDRTTDLFISIRVLSQRRIRIDCAQPRQRMKGNEVTDATYVLGHHDIEVRRLELQARLLAPGTTRILRAAGLTKGMSILDIGTGAGDVAMLAAEIVGPSATVLGIDQEFSVLERARIRTKAAGLHRVSYKQATIDALATNTDFDALIGRLVLCWQPDRIGFLIKAAAHLRPGGMLVFVEPGGVRTGTSSEESGERWSDPPVALYDETIQYVL